MARAFAVQGAKLDAQAWAKLEQRIAEIERIYEDAIKEASRIAMLADVDPNKMFRFYTYPIMRDRADKLFREMAAKMRGVIKHGTLEAFALANAKNDKLLDYIFASTGIDKEILKDRYQFGARNDEGRRAFEQRRIDGMGLSDRVWQTTKQARNEIELAIDGAIGEGKSAAQIARQVKQYLNEPDKLFRRVRDKHGNLQLSKAAKAYHPGRGVYRSSYKNAMRLARTEVNMAYRDADHQRWSRMDFVVGIEIRLSNNPNHCPTCEELKGKYPKDFKFIGWHPQCRCFAIPLLISDDEFDELELKLLNEGDSSTFIPENTIESIPRKAKDWYRDNLEKINRAKNPPVFVQDNQQFFKSKRAVRKNSGGSIRKIKPLKEFDGSLAAFITDTLKANRPDNTVKMIGVLSSAVLKDLSKRKIKPATESVYVTDKKILRASRDAKASKGKAVDVSRLHEIEDVLKKPLAIVRDKRTNDVIYIYAGEYDKDRLMKVVVDVNYNIGGNLVNIAKSVGLVEADRLSDKKFYEVLWGKF